MFLRLPNMWGNEVGNAGAACTAGKAILPMLSSIVKPKMFRTVLKVTSLRKEQVMPIIRCHCISHQIDWISPLHSLLSL